MTAGVHLPEHRFEARARLRFLRFLRRHSRQALRHVGHASLNAHVAQLLDFGGGEGAVWPRPLSLTVAFGRGGR